MVREKQYRYPPLFIKVIDATIKKNLADGIIKESHSPWNSNLWVVPKKTLSDGKKRYRMVIDYRKLNEQTIPDAYPLPNINEILEQVGGAKYFSVLDLYSGFNQIEIDAKDGYKTAFSTPYGHYEYIAMPFGLCNAPATFQRLMDTTCSDQTDIIHAECTSPVLICVDLNKPFILTTDASDTVIGAVLSQGKVGEDQPVAYMSRSLNKAERNYSTTEKECLAIVAAMNHFKHYLYGRTFTIYEDHEPLTWIDSIKDPMSRLNRWRAKLRGYQYKFIYKPGKLNTNSDALSRNPIDKDTILEKPDHSMASVLPLIPPKPTKTSLARQNKGKSASEVSSSESSKAITKILDKKKHSKTDQLDTQAISKGQAKLEASTIGKRLCLRREAERENLLHEFVDENQDCNDSSDRIKSVNDQISGASELDENQVIEEFKEQNSLKQINNTVIDTSSSWIQREVESPLKFHSTMRRSKFNVPSLNCPSDSEDEDEIKATDFSPKSYKNFKDDWKKQSFWWDSYTQKSSNKINEVTEKEKSNIFSKYSLDVSNKAVSVHSPEREKNPPKSLKDSETSFDYGNTGVRWKSPISHKTSIADETPVSSSEWTKLSTIEQVDSEEDSEEENIMHLSRGFLKEKNLHSFRLSSKGDLTKNLPKGTLFDLLKSELKTLLVNITVCYGECKIIKEEDQPFIIKEFHSSSFGGHRGMGKTYRRIRERFYWKGIIQDVEDYVRSCKVCQEQKLVRVKSKEKMIITDTPAEPFVKVAIDTVGPLPISHSGNKHILTMHCQFIKFCIAAPLPDIKATTIADAIARHLIAPFGVPKIILSDRGTSFTSNLMQKFAKIFGFKLCTTTTFRPSSNGSLERSHIMLSDFLRNEAEDKRDWDKIIVFAMHEYNTSVEKNLINSKYRNKMYYDRNAKPQNLEVGMEVYALKEPKIGKLDDYYKGKFIIKEIQPNNNVLLESEKGKLLLKHMDKVKKCCN
uniref:RNA-directed DNA polymerase n=1 Tax=Trichogramma kaykai TaxID=54128 RepID=A0ABD2W5T5_9HYME